MANEESGSPLRRWRPFYGAFGAIDDAIEAAGHPRAAFRDMRVQIVKMLRGTEDDGVAEQLCAALDDAMAKSLETLRAVPIPHSTPASTDLTRAVGALRNHGSARIRGLADDVVRGLATATAVKEELEVPKKRPHVPPAKTLPAAATMANEQSGRPLRRWRPFYGAFGAIEDAIEAAGHPRAAYRDMRVRIVPVAEAAKILPTVPVAEAQKKKLYLPPAKMVPSAATVSTPSTSGSKKVAVDESKIEATKRKLHEGYDEAERIKRQRIIQKIDDKDVAKMFVQKQRKMLPIVRGRGTAACKSRTFSGVRRSLLPTLQTI